MQHHEEQQYLDILKDVMENGYETVDRTGTGTLSLFGKKMEFDISGYKVPLLTTKKVFWKGVVTELLWIVSGQTNIKYLTDQGVNIWNEWVLEKEPDDKKEGNLGPVYGKQLRDWDTTDWEGGWNIDQLDQLVTQIKTNPNSRRLLFSLWNPNDINKVKLPPCHGLVTQFYVGKNGTISCQVYCRSQDLFLGTPFNIASYALLTHIIGELANLKADRLTWIGGNVHVYNNLKKAVELQLTRVPRFPFPTVKMPLQQKLESLEAMTTNILNGTLTWEDFQLENYQSDGVIKGQVSV